MSLKIGYFGSPSHSKDLLEDLVESGFQISFVVTNIDKPVGRKQILTETPVKEFAKRKGIPVFQSERLRTDTTIQDEILNQEADIHLVYAYGSIIPDRIFLAPKHRSINLHGSLLPKYRGASPVQSAILNGEKSSGFSIQYLATEVDSGDLIFSKEIEIQKEDTTESFLHKITLEGGLVLKNLLLGLGNTGTLPMASPQDHSKATHCKKIRSENRPIDWSKTRDQIHNQIRALYPDPLATTEFRGKRVVILSSFLPTEEESKVGLGSSPMGSFFLVGKKRLFSVCGDGNLLGIESLVPEGKKPMKGFEFFNGARVNTGDTFT
ncbi:MAG: methionyl-tRNA formyltransferase [Leptospira sp.]|nr:methionyl-tRNA formyltransferase [Leptospira sp.]